MKILIPASEGKTKVTAKHLKFQDTNFKFNDSVRQVVNLLELIDEEDLRSIYGTSQEKSAIDKINQFIMKNVFQQLIDIQELYENIGWNNLDNKAQEYLQKHIFIFSGLLGW